MTQREMAATIGVRGMSTFMRPHVRVRQSFPVKKRHVEKCYTRPRRSCVSSSVKCRKVPRKAANRPEDVCETEWKRAPDAQTHK